MTGWSCTAGSPTTASICHPICKDGILVGNETCDDDGNYLNYLGGAGGCNSTCTGVIVGWTCILSSNTTITTTCTAVCGDGIVVWPPEDGCDDGNIYDNKGCNANCLGAITGWNCTGGTPTTATSCVPICGDGICVGSETCDDGNSVDNIGCNAPSCIGVMAGYT